MVLTMLVVEDELSQRAVERLLRGWTVRAAGNLAAARRLLGSEAFDGAVVDTELPDGNGLDLVERIRESGAKIPVLVLTAHCERELVNRAQRIGAEFGCKPLVPQNLLAFAERAALASSADREVIARVSELARRHGLTPRETAVATLAVRDLPRQAIQAELGVSVNTIKTQVRSLLQKCGAPNLAALRRELRASHGLPPPSTS
jgi:DNA-binding NarL/FixJ family response regulator